MRLHQFDFNLVKRISKRLVDVAYQNKTNKFQLFNKDNIMRLPNL